MFKYMKKPNPMTDSEMVLNIEALRPDQQISLSPVFSPSGSRSTSRDTEAL